MPLKVKATCRDCQATRMVWKFEMDRAARPRCLKCGGPLEYSQSAQEDLTKTHSHKTGAVPKSRRPQQEPSPRLIPEREAQRYEFNVYPTVYEQVMHQHSDVAEALKDIGPLAYYERLTRVVAQAADPTDLDLGKELLCNAEHQLYLAGRPYYKVWPSIAAALCDTEMRVPGEYFRVPTDGFEVRFPKKDNPLFPVRAACVARLPGWRWTDGREWSLAVLFIDGEATDPTTKTWMADLPIRPGMRIEESLALTNAMDQVPDPDLVRRMVRVACGVCFFAVDQHETILPDLRRKTIDRYLKEKRPPTDAETKDALTEAKALGLGGFKVGSEITLPLPSVRYHTVGTSGSPNGHGLSAGHVRRGFIRNQKVGPRSEDGHKIIFVPPCLVRADLGIQSTHGYRIKTPNAS